MNTNSSLTGQIDLLALMGAHLENGNIVIPSNNPSVFVCRTKSGADKAYLDIVIRESPNNQFGNTHFVKASVGKTNRERMGITKEALKNYTPIIGNLKPYEFQSQQSAPAPQEPIDISEDLPEDTFQGF